MTQESNDNVATKAALFDQERRLEALESMIFGTSRQALDPPRLLTLYTEACRREQPIDRTTVELWSTILLSFDVMSLVHIGRLTRDYAPWKIFVLLLEHHSRAGFDVKATCDHMLKLAKELLCAQGLEILNPEDLLGTPPAIYKAIAAIST